MERLIQGIGKTSPQNGGACPKCGGGMKSEGMRGVTIHTAMGSVEYERRYLRCERCGEGTFPLDRELGLDAQHNTPALQKMASFAGAEASFERARDLLGEIGSIPMAARKVERITEQVGEQAERWMRGRQERARAGVEKASEPGPERLYVEVDGTTVPMRPAEALPKGPPKNPEQERLSKGQRTPGKVEYREVKLGAVFEAEVDEHGKRRAGPKTYTGTFEEAETCVRQVVAEARARGSDPAKEVVVLCDGAEWIWKRLPPEFPGKKITQILDWGHPSERLSDVAKLVFGQGTPQAEQWADQQLDLLYEGRVTEVIAAMEQLHPRSTEAQEFLGQCLGYFRDHSHRMNYAELRAQGYFIGSGTIESACKHVVSRLKGAGMKWSREHVPRVLALRVCRASGWWERFWRERAGGVAA
jgi:hypothetical protein